MGTPQPPSNHEVLESARFKFRAVKTFLKDGIFYAVSSFIPDYEEMFRQISSAELQPDDVLACGFPRSGNHWLFDILNMILTQDTKYTGRLYHENFLEISGSGVSKMVWGMSHPRIFCSHAQPQVLPRAILETPVKIVYIMRNPKDTLVSWYKLCRSIKLEGDVFEGSWDEFFELQLTGEFGWGSWFQHILVWEKFMKDNPSVHVKVIQFEKLKEQPEAVIADLCRFLGQSETLVKQIVDATSFENMKAGTKERENKTNDIFVKEGETVAMVKGKVNSWKTRFTVDQNERFNKYFEEVFAASDLANQLRPYIL